MGFTAHNSFESPPDSNVTQHADFAGSGEAGLLRDVQTGLAVAVTLTTCSSGVVFGSQGANPLPGTDAAEIFAGFALGLALCNLRGVVHANRPPVAAQC